MNQNITPFHIAKADGTLEPYQEDKIIHAVRKAALHTDEPLSSEDEQKFVIKLREYIDEHVPSTDVVITVNEVHYFVLRLIKYVRPDIANKYNTYKNHKVQQAKQAVALIDRLNTQPSFIDTDSDERVIEDTIRERIKTIIHKLKTKHHIDRPVAFVVLNILFEDIHYQKPTDVDALLSVLKDDVGLQTLTNWIMIELEKAER